MKSKLEYEVGEQLKFPFIEKIELEQKRKFEKWQYKSLNEFIGFEVGCMLPFFYEVFSKNPLLGFGYYGLEIFSGEVIVGCIVGTVVGNLMGRAAYYLNM